MKIEQFKSSLNLESLARFEMLPQEFASLESRATNESINQCKQKIRQFRKLLELRDAPTSVESKSPRQLC